MYTENIVSSNALNVMQYCRLKIEIMSECNVDLIEEIRKCIIYT